MNIKYLSDNVNYISPSGGQPNYQAVISIVFTADENGPFEYVEALTAGTTEDSAVAVFNSARAAITDDTLSAFAATNPAVYVAPPSPTPPFAP